MSLIRRLKQSVAKSRILGKAYVFKQRLTQSNRRRKILFFPDQMFAGSAGDLRACAIAKELRRRGWRTVIVPPWLNRSDRDRIVQAEQPDFVFLQQSRHPLNRPSFYANIPCIFDADDADIDRTPELVAECCRSSRAVIAGSSYLAKRFRDYNSDVSVVWTGTYITSVSNSAPNAQRQPTVAWAQSDPFDYPAEADLVREVVLQLAKRCKFTFVLYGVQDRTKGESYLAPLRARGILVNSFPPLRYGQFIRSLTGSAIGLQPISEHNPFSRGKSFGKLLAYLAADVAVVASDAVDHPYFFSHQRNGMLVRSVDQWVDACQHLLEQPEERRRMVNNARNDFLKRLTIAAAAEMIDEILKSLSSPQVVS